MSSITFSVFGVPVGAGSKNSFVPTDRRTGQPFRKNGRIVVNTVDTAAKRGAPWSAAVKEAAAVAMGDRPILVGVPIRLEVLFFMPRPKGHFRTGKNAHLLHEWAANEPHIKAPDSTKLVRRLEDALKGVVWHDDCQVNQQACGKMYSTVDRGWRPGAVVTISW